MSKKEGVKPKVESKRIQGRAGIGVGGGGAESGLSQKLLNNDANTIIIELRWIGRKDAESQQTVLGANELEISYSHF